MALDYRTVIEKIILKEKEIIGGVALNHINSLEGIQANENEITFKGEFGKEDVEKVVEKFKEISGKGAIGVARMAVRELDREGIKKLNLPFEILPEKIKIEKFGEAF